MEISQVLGPPVLVEHPFAGRAPGPPFTLRHADIVLARLRLAAKPQTHRLPDRAVAVLSTDQRVRYFVQDGAGHVLARVGEHVMAGKIDAPHMLPAHAQLASGPV